jgi:hypothetical protein
MDYSINHSPQEESMKVTKWLGLFLLAIAIVIAGCNKESTPAKPTTAAAPSAKAAEETAKTQVDSEVDATLAKLDPADRDLAKAQHLCPVSDEELGSMGVPPKVTIGDQPVFLCCKGCEKAAMEDPQKTLAKVKELKDKK